MTVPCSVEVLMDTEQPISTNARSSSALGSNRDSQSVSSHVSQATSKLSEAAQQAGSLAKEGLTSLSSQATSTVKDVLNQQVNAGAKLAGHVAESVKRAADNLDQNVPQLAGLVRGAAAKIEALSAEARNKSVDELFLDASGFARRRPALVFGAAAVVGFALFRILKAGASNEAERRGQDGSNFDRGPGPRMGQPENLRQNRRGPEDYQSLRSPENGSNRASRGGPYGA
jgi:hypothetical protein